MARSLRSSRRQSFLRSNRSLMTIQNPTGFDNPAGFDRPLHFAEHLSRACRNALPKAPEGRTDLHFVPDNQSSRNFKFLRTDSTQASKIPFSMCFFRLSCLIAIFVDHFRRSNTSIEQLTMTNGKVHRNPSIRPCPQHIGRVHGPNQRPGGRTAPYPLEARHLGLLSHQLGRRQDVVFVAGRINGMTPSDWTIQRYRNRFQHYGHFQAFQRSGNRRSQVLVGLDLVLLALYNVKYPTATGAEKIAFLWNGWGRNQPNGGRLYDESQITRAEQGIGLSRKVVATSAIRAFDNHVLLWRYRFWTQPFPFGIANVPRSTMIDIDECKLILDDGNRKRAKCRLERRCRVTGHYNGAGRRLIFGISGDDDGRRWLRLESEGGTNFIEFIEFILTILNDIGQGVPGNRRVFLMDNLNVHHDAIIRQMIYQAGHYIIYRAPYWPKDGAIEYFFNALEMALRSKAFHIANAAEFETAIRNIIASYPNFVAFFEHLGYNN